MRSAALLSRLRVPLRSISVVFLFSFASLAVQTSFCAVARPNASHATLRGFASTFSSFSVPWSPAPCLTDFQAETPPRQYAPWSVPAFGVLEVPQNSLSSSRARFRRVSASPASIHSEDSESAKTALRLRSAFSLPPGAPSPVVRSPVTTTHVHSHFSKSRLPLHPPTVNRGCCLASSVCGLSSFPSRAIPRASGCSCLSGCATQCERADSLLRASNFNKKALHGHPLRSATGDHCSAQERLAKNGCLPDQKPSDAVDAFVEDKKPRIRRSTEKSASQASSSLPTSQPVDSTATPSPHSCHSSPCLPASKQPSRLSSLRRSPVSSPLSPQHVTLSLLPSLPTFAGLPLPPYLSAALDAQEISAPTGIQQTALGPLAAGEDLLLHSETGSGKTFAYLLPLLHWHHHANNPEPTSGGNAHAESLLRNVSGVCTPQAAAGGRGGQRGKAARPRRDASKGKRHDAGRGAGDACEEEALLSERYLAHAACLDAPEVARALRRATGCSLIVTPTRELAVQVAHEIYMLLRTKLFSFQRATVKTNGAKRTLAFLKKLSQRLKQCSAKNLKDSAAAAARRGETGVAPALLARASRAETQAEEARAHLVNARLGLAQVRGEGKRPRLLLVLGEPLASACDGEEKSQTGEREPDKGDDERNVNLRRHGETRRSEELHARGDKGNAAESNEARFFDTETKHLPSWAKEKIGSSLIVVGSAQTLRRLLQRLGAVQPDALETFLKRVKHVVFDEADRLLQPLTRYAPLKTKSLRTSRPRPASLLFSSLLIAKKPLLQRQTEPARCRSSLLLGGNSIALASPALCASADGPAKKRRGKASSSSLSSSDFLRRIFIVPHGSLSPSPRPSSGDFQIIAASATVGRPLRRQLAEMLLMRDSLKKTKSLRAKENAKAADAGEIESAKDDEEDEEKAFVSAEERKEMTRVLKRLQSRGLVACEDAMEGEIGKAVDTENESGKRLMKVARPPAAWGSRSPQGRRSLLVGLPATLEHFLHATPRGNLATLVYETSLLLHRLRPHRAIIFLDAKLSVVSFLLHLRRLGIEHTQLLHEAFGFHSPRLTARLTADRGLHKVSSASSPPASSSASSRIHFHFANRERLAQDPSGSSASSSPLTSIPPSPVSPFTSSPNSALSSASSSSPSTETGGEQALPTLGGAGWPSESLDKRADEDAFGSSAGAIATEERQTGDRRALLLTSMATARGLHFDNLDFIFLVGDIENAREYQHLAGRAGRRGRPGKVICVSESATQKCISSWAKNLGVTFQPSQRLLFPCSEAESAHADASEDEQQTVSSNPESRGDASRRRTGGNSEERQRQLEREEVYEEGEWETQRARAHEERGGSERQRGQGGRTERHEGNAPRAYDDEEQREAFASKGRSADGDEEEEKDEMSENADARTEGRKSRETDAETDETKEKPGVNDDAFAFLDALSNFTRPSFSSLLSM
uniref:DEAD/DEAH box helicase, putative n=1 Tax=Toxoplasma gondii (strain ATCC 50861 / VEG) TaxID=432359 RepID=A0A0F7UTH6_TOXGV|nr:TPA: DEAD/DEAH box helicase, putative [Toxoplasma gondii VEG]